ncbi:MAG: hypothetical protein IJC93_06100 [Clostridia bacterium]|nr:hypothetical protein [Clostridia bacterium]
MKNILLLGDSIRIGYDKSVQKALEGKANVFFPEDNCRFAAYLFRHLVDYRKLLPEGETADVVHWNAGLWDCLHLLDEDVQTPIEIYEYYIERICVRIRTLFPQAKVIFATSTSVVPEQMDVGFARRNEEIEAYNAAAVAIVTRHGFAVNDLYAMSVDLPMETRTGPTHFYTEAGTAAFTDAVLAHLLPAIGLDLALADRGKTVIHTDDTEGF